MDGDYGDGSNWFRKCSMWVKLASPVTKFWPGFFSGFESPGAGFMWYLERANTQSNSPHRYSRIASIQGDPIVFGGLNSIKTERLNWSNDVAKGYKTILHEFSQNLPVYLVMIGLCFEIYMYSWSRYHCRLGICCWFSRWFRYSSLCCRIR